MRRLLRHPVRVVPVVFLAAILIGTGLLMLPFAHRAPGYTPFVVALFTATSAVSVTGMNVVDTPTYWTDNGLVLITVLTQVGGFGILALATLLLLVVSRQLGLRNRLLVAAETAEFALGDVAWLLRRIARTVLVCEGTMTAVIAARLWLAYDYPPGRAIWYGIFHAVQAFNNAGFSLFPGSLISVAHDGWILIPLALGAIVGGMGFPALFEAVQEWRRPVGWTIATKLTVWGSGVLLVAGLLGILYAEWNNPRTLGPFSWPQKLLAAFAQDSLLRTAGFSVLPTDALAEESYPLLIILMLIGGGSASTAGGIKVSTFFLLALVIWAELRGEPDVVLGPRRVSQASQRQAVTVTLLSVALVVLGTIGIIVETQGVLYYTALFEVTSAFSTSGLSVGLAPALPPYAQGILVMLMYVGRVGPLVLGSAIALNTRRRLYRYPEEQPVVG